MMQAPSRLADLVDSAHAGNAGAPTQEQSPLLREFLDRLDEACDRRYRLHHGEVELVRQLIDTYQFFHSRPAGTVGVRITEIPADAGPRAGNTMIEVIAEEQPFVVDTIGLFLDFTGLQIASSCFATLPVWRDADGVLIAFNDDDDRARPRDDGDQRCREILSRFEIHGGLDPLFVKTIEDAVRERVQIASGVVRDFQPAKATLKSLLANLDRLLDVAPESECAIIEDVRDLIDWLLEDNFIIVGLSFYPESDTALPEPDESRAFGHVRLSHDDLAECGEKILGMSHGDRRLEQWLVAYKSQEESMIHRAGKIDSFLLKSYDERGRHEGYYHLRGLFTFKAIQTLGGQIPVVRLKLATLLERVGYKQDSIQWKAYTNAFNSIPVEYLFEAKPAEIAAIIDTILYVEKAKELRTHVVIDSENRKGLYFLVLPRQGYSEELRTRIENILIEGLGATYSDSRVYFGKFDTVLLTFFFTATECFKEFSREALDERVRSTAGTWNERFYRMLSTTVGAERAQQLEAHYRHAFAEDYQLATQPKEAAADVAILETLRLAGLERIVAFSVFYGESDRRRRTCRLRVYLSKNVYLSSLLPILDNFGLQIIDQAAFRFQLTEGRELHLHTFRVAGVDDDTHPLISRRDEVIEALEMVFTKRMDSDVLNKLVVDVGVGWQDVNLIRAYVNYMRQLGVSNTFAFMSNTFRRHPQLTRTLLDYHRIRFDPELRLSLDERRERCAGIEQEIADLLQQVPSQAQDNFVRLLLNLLKSTLRTSRYQQGTLDEKRRLSFKVDSSALIVGSDPRPWREVFVHHFETEGIHIRGGRLARGGLRWSDRVGDYREEVLGLMRTQMVKNVLIVPVGAKGGFIIRRPVEDFHERRAQADRLYKIYINALLDITDNVVGGEVVHPQNVVCYDGNDPYLVVAADKGTAHLSDTANAISRERNFWLGDAFASGGSNGYDHKALGITAKGAWEAVRRHFRELDLNPEVDVITVVGIGDMAGDVFGNGLLCSRTLQLRAAFNHLHIFLDPSPDTQLSYHERRRLFEMPRSSWLDYRQEIISNGGGVYERNAKQIELEEPALTMLGLSGARQRPDDVIRAILEMRADLLWNGGIGTYIKASKEDDRDVGDLANSQVRVSAKRVKFRVVGEGGNLGVTQAGRIELAERGCRLNTDFVDNSAGVNCSDNEVNLKILLEHEVSVTGALTVDERNQLLRDLSDDVCASVLRSNYNQSLMISLDEVRSRRDLFSFERAIKTLEDRGRLNRQRESLPPLPTLLNRASSDRGLTRPELATVAAYAKMEVYQQLLDATDESFDGLDDYLTTYFPNSIVERFGKHFGEHLLHREIALTVVTNLIIDHAGAAFFFDASRETGSSYSELVRAYALVDEIFQSWGMKEKLLGLDGMVPAELQYDALIAVEEATRRSVAWVVGGQEGGRLDRLAAERNRYAHLMKAYEAELPAGLSRNEHKRFLATEDVYYDAGFLIGLPDRLARFNYLPAGLRIVDICFSTGADVAAVTRLYFQIGQDSQIFPLIRLCDDKVFHGRWESLALRIVRNSLLDSLWSLTARVVRELKVGDGESWLDAGNRVARAQPQYDEIRLDLKKLITEDLTIAALQVMGWRLAQNFGVQA